MGLRLHHLRTKSTGKRHLGRGDDGSARITAQLACGYGNLANGFVCVVLKFSWGLSDYRL